MHAVREPVEVGQADARGNIAHAGDATCGVTNVNDFNAKLIAEFRENDGRIGGAFDNTPLVLITHTGAQSGRQRTNPLAYSRDGDDLVVIASKAGAPTNPDWYHNIVANPEVTVELPGERYRARARVATGAERDRLYAAMAESLPNFSDYQRKTTRTIPVIVIERI